MMNRILISLALLLLSGLALADSATPVTVQDPYIEMRTGVGPGYPIFHVAERGEQVIIHARRTDWYRVETDRGRIGWVSGEQLTRTLGPGGGIVDLAAPGMGEFVEARWEAGLALGDFDGANVITAFGGRGLTRHLSVEFSASQILGDFSDGWMADVGVAHLFFPEWRASPFFSLGTGIIHIEPKATLTQAEDRTDQMAYVGLGMRAWLSKRFIFRAEYKGYVVFTSTDDNEEVDEWKAGFSFFF